VAVFLPVATSHSRISPGGASFGPALSLRVAATEAASVLPSGLKATDQTMPVISWSVMLLLPVATSHSRISLVGLPLPNSPPPAARVLPSGPKATDQTMFLWPRSVAVLLPVATSQIFSSMSPSGCSRPPHEASSLPSGLNATRTGPPAFSVLDNFGCWAASGVASSNRPAKLDHSRTPGRMRRIGFMA
jgi:hypothetical protein